MSVYEKTFTLKDEDHTMGNTLRYVLNKNPAVSFVGYSVPHPAEPKLQLRLQTVGPPAAAVLQDALGTVHDIGQHVLGVFDEAVAVPYTRGVMPRDGISSKSARAFDASPTRASASITTPNERAECAAPSFRIVAQCRSTSFRGRRWRSSRSR